MIMADKGFDIQHLLTSKCVTLNIPPFLHGKEQVETKNIASVYVERVIEWVKNYFVL